MEKNFEEEKEYLEKTIKRFQKIIADTELRLDAVPRMHSDNPILLANLLSQYNQRLDLLKKTENKPYFARLDFKNNEDGVLEECYIGKVGVLDDDNKIVTVDWRAPIASMYYDSNIGNASYEAPQGLIEGELLVKRQYDIEDKVLKGFQDVDTVSNDEILKPYLGVSADNRLKNIVATIQSEQNEIIREKIFNDVIIQGVAGSGKTTVALHRIAYLVYNNMKHIKPEQYLVIGPNKFFVNYISGVLPDLDVNNVSQLTYDEILKTLLEENFTLLSDENKLKQSISNPNKLFFERLRVSMVYKDAIDKFLADYSKTIVPAENFVIKGYDILPLNLVNRVYESIEDDGTISYDILAKKMERTYLLLGKYIEEHYESLLSYVHNQFYERAKGKSKADIEKERKNLTYVEKELRNQCNQSLKKYFSNSRPKILNLYMLFLKNINNYLKLEEFDIVSSSKKVSANIKSRKIEFEDLGALIYLYYRIYGSNDFSKYRHAVIDEAQDFGEFNFYALKQLMPKSTFSIFGDLAQSIYQYRGVKNWNDVIDTTFDGKCELKYLKKSYRTTTEIMNSANNITKHLGLSSAEPVIRHGVDVEYSNVDDRVEDYLIPILDKYIENGYSSIAIISKDEDESNKINQLLAEKGIYTNNITTSDEEYHGGICTITSYLAKGLEFDGVIITDASENRFNSSNPTDMKLLYVSMTRPLHELHILYTGELTKPLLEDLKKNKNNNGLVLKKKI